VRVAAEINWDTISRTEERFDPDGQVIRISTIDDENVESTTPSTAASPVGVQTNAGTGTNNNAAASGPTVSAGISRTKKKTSNNQYEINRTLSNIMQSSGGLKRVSAAVFVSQRVDTTGTAPKPVVRTPEELQKLRRIVQSALGIVENNPDRTDEITLEEMPFNEQPVLEIARQLDQQQTREYWTSTAQRYAFPALGLVVFLLFWRALKRAKPEDVTLGMPYELTADGRLVPSPNSPGKNGKNGAPEEPQVVTVEVLNQLIREQPGNMTQAVRTWMSRGSAVK
jgi:flagellar M-ring protein FliF